MERYVSRMAQSNGFLCDDEQHQSRFSCLCLGHHVYGRHCPIFWSSTVSTSEQLRGYVMPTGFSLALWSFVSPHGYIELTTIFIAGGAGLKLGYSLIAPSLYTRKHALTDAARIAVQLLGGCVALLIVAGTIEGFVSPSKLPNAVKIGFGAVTGILLFTYLFAMKAPNVDTSSKS